MEIIKSIYNRRGLKLNSLEIKLDNTTIIMLEGYKCFFMCGALDVDVYKNRKVICGKAVGVKTLDELFDATIYDSSLYAKELGIVPGLKVYEAFEKMAMDN